MSKRPGNPGGLYSACGLKMTDFKTPILLLLGVSLLTLEVIGETGDLPPLPDRYTDRTIHLQEGENWVSLFLIPGSNTVAEVLGVDTLPAGPTMTQSTRVQWYATEFSGLPVELLWLDPAGGWRYAEGGNANRHKMPVDEGFSIVLPEGVGPTSVVVRERVPLERLRGGKLTQILKAPGVYNVVDLNVDHRTLLKDAGLREAGFTGAPAGEKVNPNNSDELRVMQAGGRTLAAPKARILMNAEGGFVFWTGGTFLGSAEEYELDWLDTLVVYTGRSASNLVWTIDVPLPIPAGPDS